MSMKKRLFKIISGSRYMFDQFMPPLVVFNTLLFPKVEESAQAYPVLAFRKCISLRYPLVASKVLTLLHVTPAFVDFTNAPL